MRAGSSDRVGSCAILGNRRRDLERGTHVGLGRPVEVEVPGRRPKRFERAQMDDREYLAREEHETQFGIASARELTVPREQREYRRNRVPDRDPALGDQRRQPQGLLSRALADQHYSCAVTDRDVEIEDGQVEME